MKSTFTSQSTDPHFKKEEEQWAEILSKGNPYAGVILITSQKLCTITHELQKAFDENQVQLNQVIFYGSRLADRTDRLLKTLYACGTNFSATKEFEELKEKATNLKNDQDSYKILKEFPELVHIVNHKLTDEIEKELNR